MAEQAVNTLHNFVPPELTFIRAIPQEKHVDQTEYLPEGLACKLQDLPEFAFVARRGRQLGESLRDQRMDMLRQGNFDQVPMPIDMTGTARRVVEAEDTHGAGSHEAALWRNALRGDTDRQVAEVTSKMTWGYFQPLVHKFDQSEKTFLAYGHSVRGITENGISPMAEAEDTERSINDHTAELMDEAFMQSQYADDYILLTVSECADWAISDYDDDVAQGLNKRAYGGYVPEIEKIMVRASSFDTAKQERQLELAAVPGTVISRTTLHDALAVLGATEPGTILSKTELQGTRIMVRKDVMSGVLDFVKLVDALASEETERTVFMGEIVDSKQTPSYATVPAESDRRNQEFVGIADKLAHKMVELEREGVDKWQTELHVSAFLKNSLLEVVKSDPEQARIIFDDATADGYIHRQELIGAGRYAEAQAIEDQVAAAAPAPSSCGAGSCQLESVKSGDPQAMRIAKMFGKTDTTGMLEDKSNRACKSCGENKLYYNTEKGKADTACGGCGSVMVNNKLFTQEKSQPKSLLQLFYGSTDKSTKKPTKLPDTIAA